MKLFERDYFELNSDEIEKWNDIKSREILYINNKPSRIRRNMFVEYPKAIRHYLSLFPNNYLDPMDLKDPLLEITTEKFLNLLNSSNCSERSILNFIKDYKAYYIVASVLKKNYNFGHHGTYLFPEFELGNSYKADFLLIGKSSSGYEFIFIEFESPIGNVTIGDGELGEVFRKGLKQINDWEEWLEANYGSLHDNFNKVKSSEKSLDKEFYKFDRTRIHFVVIAGRRNDFKEKTYRIKRKKIIEENIMLFHYDNLYDSAFDILCDPTY